MFRCAQISVSAPAHQKWTLLGNHPKSHSAVVAVRKRFRRAFIAHNYRPLTIAPACELAVEQHPRCAGSGLSVARPATLLNR
jgi:hypothetical protein